jgi:phage-related protein
MPSMLVQFYREPNGVIPIVGWLKDLRTSNERAFAKCNAKIDRLREEGSDLGPPESKPLRDGIHELRIQENKVNYRILYFFHGKDNAVLSHGITKIAEVPPGEIDLAVKRKKNVAQRPDVYIYTRSGDNTGGQ